MPAHTLAQPLTELRTVCGEEFPLVAYGNIGYVDDSQGWVNTDSTDHSGYLQQAHTWPAQIVGACCGSTPEHIRMLKRKWQNTDP
jgi:methionine synthase I (cobalamin-dependent)